MRVRMALHEKELKFEVFEVDLNNPPEELLKLHPEGRVPLLLHNGLAIYESSIITEYLEEAFSNTPKLMPLDAFSRAKVRLWTYWCNTRFKVDVDHFKYGVHRFLATECEGAQARVLEDLTELEQTLSQNHFLVGDTITLADLHVFPFFRQLSRCKLDLNFLSSFPKTQAWADQLINRPSFKKTMA